MPDERPLWQCSCGARSRTKHTAWTPMYSPLKAFKAHKRFHRDGLIREGRKTGGQGGSHHVI